MEIWKPIKNYEGLYEVSNLGNIRSISNRWGTRQTFRELKQQLTNKGYKRVSLSKENKHKTFLVHRLVFEAFNGRIGKNYEINHIDKNRSNNSLENLEIMTHFDNVRYSKAKKVYQYNKNNQLIKVWDSVRDIERTINIDRSSVSANARNERKTCKGYIFKYEGVV